MPHWLYIIYLFAFGSCIGSFLNVVVYRLPRGESLVHPGSHCPSCNHPLAWYDNVPVFGWLMLAGKCRYCKKPISPRYPVVEAITGSLFASFYIAIFVAGQGPFWAVYDQAGHLADFPVRMQDMSENWPIFGLYLFGASCLLAASLIDAELFLIPAPIPLLMALAGLIVHTLVDRPGLPGALAAGSGELALAAGGTIGLVISIVLLKLNILPLSFADGESPLEVDKLKRKPDEEELKEYTPGQVRKEIAKEVLFLLPPVALGIAAVLAQIDGAPLHDAWGTVMRQDWVCGLLGSLLGGLIGGGIVWFTRVIGSLIAGKEAMGLGDIDLMFGAGAIVGPGAVVVAFFIAPFFAMPLSLAMLLFRSRRQLPYGPYLSIATAVVMLFYFPIYDYLQPGFIGLENLLRMLI